MRLVKRSASPLPQGLMGPSMHTRAISSLSFQTHQRMGRMSTRNLVWNGNGACDGLTQHAPPPHAAATLAASRASASRVALPRYHTVMMELLMTMKRL
jgi:hypothetical protein